MVCALLSRIVAQLLRRIAQFCMVVMNWHGVDDLMKGKWMKSYKRLGQAREYLKNVMNSLQKKMSTGSRYISKLITSAHKDQWRRDDLHQRGRDHHDDKKK
jgi:hypothetical protein